MTISILIPTAGRPTLLNNMLKSLWETTYGKFIIEPVVVIDEDVESVRVAEDWGVRLNGALDFSPERRGALNCWNIALALSKGSIIVPAGDDQIFHEDWLEYALESHRAKLGYYGVVGMNDLAYDGNKQVATMFLFDRKYCKEQMGGVFAPPHYRYYCIDSEWNEKAKILGHFYWDERSKVEHIHSAHGKRPVDSLDQEKVDNDWQKVDNAIFEERKSRGFPIDYPPII